MVCRPGVSMSISRSLDVSKLERKSSFFGPYLVLTQFPIVDHPCVKKLNNYQSSMFTANRDLSSHSTLVVRLILHIFHHIEYTRLQVIRLSDMMKI